MSESIGGEYCIVDPDPDKPQNYLIYSTENQSSKKTLFGQLFYQFCNYDNYIYTIIIGQKLYQVKSSDLKHRRLVIIDVIQPNNSSNENENTRLSCPETLFQVTDSFSKSNQQYHVNVHDKEWPLGYLAITILLHLHES